MASQKKDFESFYKKLVKRYAKDDGGAYLRPLADRKLLEILVFAIFLENRTVERAESAFEAIEQYFIDWNEIRVSKANEIAEVVGNYRYAERDGERLRKILQIVFDKTYRFDLEEVRQQGWDAVKALLDDMPYCTRFMKEFVEFVAFDGANVPLDEGALRALRLLDYVEVVDNVEVPVCFPKKCKKDKLVAIFASLHRFGAELFDDDARDDAVEFIQKFDKKAKTRSYEPLVVSDVPDDPRELTRKLFISAMEISRQKARSSKPAMNVNIDDEEDEEREPSFDFEENPEQEEDASDGAVLSMNKSKVEIEDANSSFSPQFKSKSRASEKIEEAPLKSKKTKKSAKTSQVVESAPDEASKRETKPVAKKRATPTDLFEGVAPAPSEKTDDEASANRAKAPRKRSSEKTATVESKDDVATASERPTEDAAKERRPRKKKGEATVEVAQVEPKTTREQPARKAAKLVEEVAPAKDESSKSAPAKTSERKRAKAKKDESEVVASATAKKRKSVKDGADVDESVKSFGKSRAKSTVEKAAGKSARSEKNAAKRATKAAAEEQSLIDFEAKAPKKEKTKRVKEVKEDVAVEPDRKTPRKARSGATRKGSAIVDSQEGTNASERAKRSRAKSSKNDDAAIIKEIQKRKPR